MPAVIVILQREFYGLALFSPYLADGLDVDFSVFKGVGFDVAGFVAELVEICNAIPPISLPVSSRRKAVLQRIPARPLGSYLSCCLDAEGVGLKWTRLPNGKSSPFQCPSLKRVFHADRPSTTSMLDEKHQCGIAYVHHSGSIPAWNNSALVPSTTLLTALSATPLVSGRPGVAMSLHSLSACAAAMSSGAWSE